MARSRIDAEIERFRRVLSAWQWMSELSEDPDEVVRLLNIDVRKIGELAYEYADHAAELLEVMDDYKQLATQVQDRTENRRRALASSSFTQFAEQNGSCARTSLVRSRNLEPGRPSLAAAGHDTGNQGTPLTLNS
ncbi:hypothetical protein [Devosia sp. RR2S18]|uniref:hypothetical protein n=1 Tax=Devosia rhizosphaerae TaxID=3049774 RepID=UPI00253FE33E|nr:hypothetical protein [Devosia sp. RR2S18]WIJ26120.1 hypothetical protein QOV41_04975 [Devosia sp. RR2S18]